MEKKTRGRGDERKDEEEQEKASHFKSATNRGWRKVVSPVNHQKVVGRA